MSGNILTFPTELQRIPPPAANRRALLNRTRRLHLYDPTQDTLTSRALDLASQIGISVSHINREIVADTTRDRQRRIFGTA